MQIVPKTRLGISRHKRQVIAAMAWIFVLSSESALAQKQSARPMQQHVVNNALEFDDVEVQGLLSPPSLWPKPIVNSASYIAPSPTLLRIRLEAMSKMPDVADPIVLKLRTNHPLPLVEQMGKLELARALQTPQGRQEHKEFLKRMTARMRDFEITLLAEDLAWLDLEKLGQVLRISSVAPSIRPWQWEQIFRSPADRALAREHLGDKADAIIAEVNRWLSGQKGDTDISLMHFLPKHFKQNFGKYSPLRGRNCFATALSFADKGVEHSKLNILREPGHARPMINNDEFSHALWLGYYELDAQEILAGLKLGDIVVFYDRAEGQGYRSLRHAVVHVAGTTYIHKRSKSAASPIEFVDWSGLIATWSDLTKKLDYKAYRKLPMGDLRYQDQQIAIEKIFWSQ